MAPVIEAPLVTLWRGVNLALALVPETPAMLGELTAALARWDGSGPPDPVDIAIDIADRRSYGVLAP